MYLERAGHGFRQQGLLGVRKVRVAHNHVRFQHLSRLEDDALAVYPPAFPHHGHLSWNF